MVGGPEGKNTDEWGWSSEDTRRSAGEGGKLNYWEEDSVELMSLHLQGSNI